MLAIHLPRVIYITTYTSHLGAALALKNYFTEVCSGSEAGSYSRSIDSCITQLKAEEPPRTCNESGEEEEEVQGYLTHKKGQPP